MLKIKLILSVMFALLVAVSCSTPDSRLRDSVLEGNEGLRKMYFFNINTLLAKLKENGEKVGYKTAMLQYLNDRSFKHFKHGILLAYPEKCVTEEAPEINEAIVEFCKQKIINYYIADCGTSLLPIDGYAHDGYWIIVKYDANHSQNSKRD